MTADRYVLAGAIVVAAISIDTWSGARAFAYVAGALGVFAVHERLRREFAPAVATLASVLILGGTSLFWFMTRAPGIGDALAFAVAAGGMWWLSREHSPTTRSIAALVTAALSLAAFYAAARAVPGDNSASATVTNLLFSSSAGWFSDPRRLPRGDRARAVLQTKLRARADRDRHPRRVAPRPSAAASWQSS